MTDALWAIAAMYPLWCGMALVASFAALFVQIVVRGKEAPPK